MHVITQKRIWDAKGRYPESASALDGWYRVIKKNEFGSFSELKQAFNSVDKVGGFYIFDVGGNKLRLITNIYFNFKKVYIREILTHTEYSNAKWKK